MELLGSTGEELPHYLQPWASTAVKSQIQMTLPNYYVCISVSLIDHYHTIRPLTIDHDIISTCCS